MFHYFWKYFADFTSYFILYGLLGLFFFIRFVIKPQVLENSISILFLGYSIGIFSFLKIFFIEIRPYLLEFILTKSKLKFYDCETGFGMPSGHVFTSLCLYYIYKINFFTNSSDLHSSIGERLIDQDKHYPIYMESK